MVDVPLVGVALVVDVSRVIGVVVVVVVVVIVVVVVLVVVLVAMVVVVVVVSRELTKSANTGDKHWRSV